MKIAWVTDSTANLSKEFLEENDVYSVPIQVILGNDVLREGIDVTPEQLFEKINQSKETPTTSQPSLGDFTTLYTELKDRYDAVIAVHISSALSGTYATSKMAAETVDIPVTMVDSKLLSEPMAHLIREGMKLEKTGATVEEIVEKMESLIAANETIVTIGNLAALNRSGRMSNMQYILGSMLQIKPIIALVDGKLEVAEKIRTAQRAEKKLMKRIEEAIAEKKIKSLSILHVNALDKARQWKDRIQETYHSLEVNISDLTAAVGVHTGEGTIAFSWFSEEK